MPRKNLIDFTSEEFEIINECIEEGNYDHPLYKEYKEISAKQEEVINELFSQVGVKKEQQVYSEEELDKELQEMLDYEF